MNKENLMDKSQVLDAPPAQTGEPAWDIARLFPDQGQWSEEEYLALDSNQFIEYSHGIVEVLSMPSDRHQAIVVFLIGLLQRLAHTTGGVVRVAPLRLRLWPGKIREPDLLFLASADDPRRQNQLWTGADLVVEIVSPDDPDRDLVTKRREYAQAGIPEYWIVDHRNDEISVLWLEGSSYREQRYRRGDQAQSVGFPSFTVDVAAALDAD